SRCWLESGSDLGAVFYGLAEEGIIEGGRKGVKPCIGSECGDGAESLYCGGVLFRASSHAGRIAVKVPTIQLPTSLKTRLAQGHPWVYRNHLASRPGFPSGPWVKVRSGGWSAHGLSDAGSADALRV